MNEPQVWTLIGVFGAALFGMIGLITQVMWRSINTQFTSLRNEMMTEFASVHRETDSIRKDIEHLERDVQAITKRLLSD